jgi:hypothetical protein
MLNDEVVLRAALNVLLDSVEALRMPSGEPLAASAAEVHQLAIDRLTMTLTAVRAGAVLPGDAALEQAGR